MNSMTTSESIQSLSSRQLHVWQAQQLDSDNPVYNITCALQFSGDISLDSLATVFAQLQQRHPIISSKVIEVDGEPKLQLLDTAPVLLPVPQSLVTLSDERKAKALIEQVIDINKETFQFYTEQQEDKLLLVIKGHHINFDQWALQVLVSDLLAFLEAQVNGQTAELAALDYQVMFKEKPEPNDSTAASHDLYPIDFCNAGVTPATNHYDGISFREESADALAHIKACAAEHGVTSFSVVLASVFLTLFHTTGQTDLTIGVPMARRTRRTRAILGHYSDVETVSITDIDHYTGSKLIQDVAAQLTQLLLSGQKNQDAAKHINVTCNYLAKLKSNGIRAGITPLMIGRKGVELFLGDAQNIRVQGIPVEPGVSQFDIEFTHFETDGGLCRKVVASENTFTRASLNRITDIQVRYLELLTHSGDFNVAELPILTESEQELVLERSNQQNQHFFSDTTLHQWFAKSAEQYPENHALTHNGKSLSYQQLEQRANALAHHLREQYQRHTGKHLEPDTLIALYMQPSFEMLVAILAVCKAGGAYVPLSPDHASERTAFILSDTNPALLISDKNAEQEILAKCTEAQVNPHLVFATDVTELVHSAPEVNVSPQNLAYVIYTSGTTGQPKGVMQTHENVVRLFTANEQDYGFNEADIWVLYHAYTFDFSVWEMWGALLYGGKLCIVDPHLIRDFDAFAAFCNEQQVTVLNQTPAAFYEFSAATLRAKLPQTKLRYVIFGGDKLNPEMLIPWWNQFGDSHPLLVNMYGITETTVHVTYKALSFENTSKASYIGRPIWDMKAYVLNSKMQLVEPGAMGELYIGGAGLARGYLNRDELTAERFIENPFATELDIERGHQRLYKTGDLARRLADGELEYIGRNDSQVKIRGYRIELGEIESAINAHPAVAQAVVIDRENQGSAYLAAYIKLADGQQGDTLDEISSFVAGKLPAYMQPKTWTLLSEIPLTGNGKLDRKALPDPQFTSQQNYVAPSSECEALICNAFAELLGLEQVGIQDDFFSIGGDSILSIQLVALLRKQGIDLQVKDIFDCATASKLSERVATLQATQREILAEHGELSGAFDLLPVQTWFFNKGLEFEHYWNQNFAIQVPKSLSESVVEEALHSLAMQHDMLRTTFVEFEGKLQQVYGELSTMAPLFVVDGDDPELINKLNQKQNHFDLANGPLWQASLVRRASEPYDLLHFAVHHAIIDAVSWRIIAQDLQTLLDGGVLLEKRTSYRQWVDVMQSYLESHPQETAFWKNIAAHTASYPPCMAATSSTVWLELDKAQTASFLTDANQGFNTQGEELLLAALSQALSHTFNQKHHSITLESHGREAWREDVDINQTVGWFTCLYPVNLTQQASLADTIVDAKEALRRIPNKGLGFGPLQQQAQSLQLPPISFNYLGQMGGQSHAPWQLDNRLQTAAIDPRNKSTLLLDINALVQAEQLRIKVDSQLDGTLTMAFKANLQSAIEQVISAALEAKSQGGVSTPSDFGATNLSVSQLAQLQSSFVTEQDATPAPASSEKTQELEI